MIKINSNSLVLNGYEFRHSQELSVYASVLGRPTRRRTFGVSENGNVKLHYYDNFGIILREHPHHSLIDGIDIILNGLGWQFQTYTDFYGDISLFDTAIVKPYRAIDIVKPNEMVLKPFLGHAWYYETHAFSVQLEVRPERKKISSQTVSAVLIGFEIL